MRHQLVHRLRTSFFGMASRTFFVLAMALPLAFAVDPSVPLVTLNVDTVRALAFESDTTNYGEVKISRSTGLLSPITINLDLSGSATLTTDYTLQVNPADSAKATLVVTSASSLALTFLSGATDARIQVIAVSDVAQPIPELGEKVSISLPIIPPGTVVNGSRQRGTVTIVDANVQLATYVDRSPAYEITPEDIGGLVRDATGSMRLWFVNSSAFSVTTPFTSYAPYVDRMIEVTNAGSTATVGTDYQATYRIGGQQRCVDRFGVVVEPTVYLTPVAIRDTNEYGATSYTINGVFPGYTDGVFGQKIATQTGVTTLKSVTVERITQISGAAYLSITVGGTFQDLTVVGRSISFADITIGGVALTQIFLNGFTANAPIAQGSIVNIHYQTQVGAVITPGDLNPAVSMPVLYPQGAQSLTVDQGASDVSLAKGDVFVLNGGRYRVTGTNGSALFFTPGLRQTLLRTSSLTIQTHFEAKFDTSARETFFIPALPSLPFYGYPTGNNNENVNVAGTASDLPNGDWVDFLFSPIDDAEVEGREDILLTLVTTTASNGYDVINPTVARIPIGDNNVIVAAELTANAQVPIGDGSFTIELSQAFDTDIEVPFTVLQNPGSADASYGDDYTIANTTKDSAGRVTGRTIVPAGALSAVVVIVPNPTSAIPQNESRVIRVALDESLDYGLAGSADSSTNSTVSTITITKTIKPPDITSAATATGKVNVPFIYATTATGGVPITYSADATQLPPGLVLDATTGTISGTPTAAGPFLFDLIATNGGGTDTLNLRITINPAPPGFSSPSTATANVGSPFTYQCVANGNPTSYNAIPLPEGLVINLSTGLISGTPTKVGPVAVELTAINAGGTGKLALLIDVLPAVPSISSLPTATATVGVPFTYNIVASGATSFNATGLPAGLSVSTTTGLISGTATTVGSYTVDLSATNTGGTGTRVLTITVNAPTTTTTTTGAGTTSGNTAGGGGGMCGAGSGLAILFASLSLLLLRLTGKRR